MEPGEESPEALQERSETLSPLEVDLLLRLRRSTEPLAESELLGPMTANTDTVRGTLQRLRAKRFVVVEEIHHRDPRLTHRGEEARRAGLPERRLITLLRGQDSVDPAGLAAAGWSDEERSAAIGILRRAGYLADGVPFRLAPSTPADVRLPEEAILDKVETGAPVEERALASAIKRGLVSIESRTDRRWGASEEGRSLPLETGGRPAVGALTAEMLRDGRWRSVALRPYDVRADPPFAPVLRPHPYLEFLEEFEEILIGLGFQEALGPLLESEFWNADVLFMPQEHPARSIHDVFHVRDAPPVAPPEALLERVAAVHEGRALPGESAPVSRGWRVPYDRSFAAAPVLRSQTTAISARVLATHPRPPFRHYAIDRNFRYDPVDATHHIEFAQCEGILGGEGTSLRDLVALFRSVAEAIGIRELKIRPSYFPFTEPSIEGYVRHPRLGWIEVFPGGMFRPEVLRPLQIDVPVIAWGIGITRLALVSLGVRDIREIYTDDVARLTGRQ
ncbi:MAG: phenylalanine--tRNA ligase subunit alpha [Thermoplasmata archaeon]|nr:phenylalanine--tRNA ligase subunit alpha [Thermoplasmata archaeon]